MIVMAILGLIAAIAVPQWEKYRNMARVRLCIANLRQVDHSKQHWAFEMQKGGNDIPTMNDLTPYFNQRITPECPSGGSYRLRRVSKQPTCTLYSSGHALSNLNMDDDPAVD